MDTFGRRSVSPQERAEEAEIQKSLLVSSHLDAVFEAIHSGTPPKVHVPDYRQPTAQYPGDSPAYQRFYCWRVDQCFFGAEPIPPADPCHWGGDNGAGVAAGENQSQVLVRGSFNSFLSNIPHCSCYCGGLFQFE